MKKTAIIGSFVLAMVFTACQQSDDSQLNDINISQESVELNTPTEVVDLNSTQNNTEQEETNTSVIGEADIGTQEEISVSEETVQENTVVEAMIEEVVEEPEIIEVAEPIEVTDEPTDPQYQNLKLLAGKKLEMTYVFGLVYTDILYMDDSVEPYPLENDIFTYYIAGETNFGDLVLCLDLKTPSLQDGLEYPYIYVCSYSFESGSTNYFGFNLDGSDIKGKYEFVPYYSNANGFAELKDSPDATLLISTISEKTTTKMPSNLIGYSGDNANKLQFEELNGAEINFIEDNSSMKKAYDSIFNLLQYNR